MPKCKEQDEWWGMVLSKITTDIVIPRGGCADRRAELSILILFWNLGLHYLLGHLRLDIQNVQVSLADAARKLPAFIPHFNKIYAGMTDTEAIALIDTISLMSSL